jgi:hypothetical protein
MAARASLSLAAGLALLAAGCVKQPGSGWDAFLAAPSVKGMEALSTELAMCEKARPKTNGVSTGPDDCFKQTGLTETRFAKLLTLAGDGSEPAIRMAMIVRPYAGGVADWGQRIDESFGKLLDAKPLLLLSTAAKQCVPPGMVAQGAAVSSPTGAQRARALRAIDDPDLKPYRDAALEAVSGAPPR